MDQKERKTTSNLRPLGLTIALCLFSISAAWDMEYGIRIIGHLLMMGIIGILAVIFMTCPKHISVLDAISMLIILFFSSNGSLELALMGAALIVTALVLSAAVHQKSAKTSAVLAVCVTFTVGYILVWATFYAAQGNSLAPNELLTKLNDYFDSFKAPLAEFVHEYVEHLPEEVFAYYEKYEITKEMLISAYLEMMEDSVDMAQMLLPGCFVFIVQAMAYLGVVSFEKVVSLCRYDALLPEANWFLYPTQISCIIYLVVTAVYTITMFFSTTSVFAILVTNIWIALMPAMVACGFRSLRMRLKHPRFRRSTVVILILFVIGVFFFASSALSLGVFLLTFMGAQDVSISRSVENVKHHFDDDDHN